MANLVIVESPAKANTIKSYLGPNYKVIASKGHIRDLPKSSLGIDVDNGFEPHYINIRGKGDVIRDLKKEAKSAGKIFLATDPDREGEAISWHIASQLGIPEGTACRVTFNEITKGAVKEAIKSPKLINMNLVNSQQARRILDRIVGFSLSELLWKSVKSGLSGGRVQSVATRIIAEREREIRDFVPTEFWTIDAKLEGKSEDLLTVRYYGSKKAKKKISEQREADAIESEVLKGKFVVTSVNHKENKKLPQPPFTTSTLQQEASKRLGYQAQKTMKIAQELYDGLNLGAELGGVQGLITYMRTDSLRISDVALSSVSDYIKTNFGAEYLPKKYRVFKSGANSQDAHEAIRPSNVYITPEAVKRMLTNDQFRLYKLIWERFVACQMEAAVLDTVSVDVENSGHIFKAGGYIVKSKGYMSLYSDDAQYDDEKDSDGENYAKLLDVENGQELKLVKLDKLQHFTEPPARYTEASLIKFLEENGIGRPSTYAPIISIITSRQYVKREGRSLVGTQLGEITTKFMKDYFPEIIDYEFTANLESKLDSIEHGENSMLDVISDFYDRFRKELDFASKSEGKKEKFSIPVEESGIPCDRCGAMMVYKDGRYGRFLACPNFPTCKNTKALDKDGRLIAPKDLKPELAGFKCEACGADMVVRNGKYGTFYACINYPTCKFTKQKLVETGVNCPKCASKILARHGRSNSVFYSCERYPECDFSTWDMPLAEKCPECSSILYYKKNRKLVFCKNALCGYNREEEKTVIE